MNDGKEACQAVLKPAVDCVNAVKQYGSDKYNQGKEQVLSTDKQTHYQIQKYEVKISVKMNIKREWHDDCVYFVYQQLYLPVFINNKNYTNECSVYRWTKLCRWEQTLLNPWKTLEWLWSQSPWKRPTGSLWLAKWTTHSLCRRTTSTSTCPQRKMRRRRMVGREV